MNIQKYIYLFVLLLVQNQVFCQTMPLGDSYWHEDIQNKDNFIYDSYVTSNGHTYSVGKRDFSLLLKNKLDGTIAWAKEFKDIKRFTQIIPTITGSSFLILSDSLTFSKKLISITKTDTSGNVAWSKTYSFNEPFRNVKIIASKKYTDKYYIVHDYFLEEKWNIGVFEINGSGSVLSSSLYIYHDNKICDVAINNQDTLFVLIDYELKQNTVLIDRELAFAKIHNATKYARIYISKNIGGLDPVITDIEVADNTDVVILGTAHLNAIPHDQLKTYVLKLNHSGVQKWLKVIDFQPYILKDHDGLKVDFNGDIIAVFNDYKKNGFIFKFSNNGTVLAQKHFVKKFKHPHSSVLNKVNGEPFLAFTDNFNSDEVFLVSQINTNLNHCLLKDTTLNVFDTTLTFYQKPLSYKNYIIIVEPLPGASSKVFYNSSVFCQSSTDITECENCIPSFSPEPGKYIMSVWAKEENPLDPFQYTSPRVKIDLGSQNLMLAYPTGEIIEGWQKIECEFEIPPNTLPSDEVKIYLENVGLNNVYYDDLRVHPVSATMKSYVYDPATMRLKAVLDENNYATFYDYNTSGKLERIKKETNRGIFTIQEGRQAVIKTP